MALSYRKGLEQIGIERSTTVSYREFYVRPRSLRQTIAAMQPPESFELIYEINPDQDWTVEINGVGLLDGQWLFTSNDAKMLYAFDAGTALTDENIKWQLDFDKSDDSKQHIGQFEVFEDLIYVSRMSNTQAGNNVMVFKKRTFELAATVNEHGVPLWASWRGLASDAPTKVVALDLVDNIQLSTAVSPRDGRVAQVQFQCNVPWESVFLTCYGDSEVSELFAYSRSNGNQIAGRAVRLQTPIFEDWVQGAAFSPEGYLLISTSKSNKDDPRSADQGDFQYIYVVCPLNGYLFQTIPVSVESGFWHGQEVEGCCWAPATTPDGRAVEFHVIMNTKEGGIYMKSYARTKMYGQVRQA